MDKIKYEARFSEYRHLARTADSNITASLKRCSWATDDLLIAYHDEEYGRLKTTDQALFEKLCLEAFQAGLSWRTVLLKRDALREAFCNFDIDACAALTDVQLEAQAQNAAIIRNRRKIFAVRSNAQAAQKILSEHETLFAFVTQYPTPQKLKQALKHYGFTFAGETVCESFLQSIGLLEAHEPGCYLHQSGAEGQDA